MKTKIGFLFLYLNKGYIVFHYATSQHTHTHTHTPLTHTHLTHTHTHTLVIIDQDVLFECLMLTVNPE